MKKLLMTMMLTSLIAFVVQAHALTITPGSIPYATGVTNPTAPSNSQNAIDAVIAGLNLGAVELYKMNEGGVEEGVLKDSYETSFSYTTGASGATITYTGGNIVGDPQFLLVKDGNTLPYWYLFDLTSIWDGIETLELSGFWPQQGAISHVTLYGNVGGTSPVPEPGTIFLLGAGLMGMGFFGKKRNKA